jgi:hypothetical protein
VSKELSCLDRTLQGAAPHRIDALVLPISHQRVDLFATLGSQSGVTQVLSTRGHTVSDEYQLHLV